LRIWAPGTPPVGTTRFMAVLASDTALDAIGLPLVSGRTFTRTDGQQLRSVVVNRSFAKKFFNGRALGQTVRVALDSSPDDVREVTIVGIAGGFVMRAEREPAILYHPLTLGDLPARDLYLRIDGSGRFSAAALHAAVRQIDARVPVNAASTLADLRAERHFEKKLLARGAAALGLVALILTAGGLYGVVSYVVSLRRHEVGIRLALGAEARSIVVMITRQALMPAVLGAALGLLGAALASKVVQSSLHGASGLDIRAFAGSSGLLLSVLFVATILPARRAARVDACAALRSE
jgi:putative ABC transport system permease protein